MEDFKIYMGIYISYLVIGQGNGKIIEEIDKMKYFDN